MVPVLLSTSNDEFVDTVNPITLSILIYKLKLNIFNVYFITC